MSVVQTRADHAMSEKNANAQVSNNAVLA